MAIKKMKLVRASCSYAKLDKLINVCCGGGYFQAEAANKYISSSMGYEPLSEESPYLKTLQSLKEFSSRAGFSLTDETIKTNTVPETDTQQYLEKLTEKLGVLNEESKSLEEQLNECTSALQKYSHFKGLDVNLEEILECRFITIRFGFLPKEGYLKLTKGYQDNPYIFFHSCSQEEKGYWGIYFTPSDKALEIDRIFASLNFEMLYIPGAAGRVDEIIENLKENMVIIRSEQNALKGQIDKILEVEGDKIRSLYKKLEALQSVFEVRKFAVKNGDTCFLVGFIPADKEKALKEKLSRCPEIIAEIETPPRDGSIQPPVMLKNLRIARPFSFFVEMYGLPSYKDIDITSFVAVTYTVLFGMMFGDLGQGIVLLIAGLIAWKKMGMALGKILVPCGISSAFFGLIFGSVFGFEEALDPLYHMVGMKHKPIEVMDSINTVLLFAIAIGVVLVIAAMVINVITQLKRGKIGSALFTQNGVTGIAVYIGGANLAYGFMAKEPIFSSKVSVIMLIVGMLILFNQEILCSLVDDKKLHKPESIIDYILQNFFECIEYVLSYFSNTVSFLRVGAFVIVHASMMMVVFTLAGDTKSIGGIIVVILGNILVIALEGLLTGIQGLRLEFYEMFSRFYEGEGKAFEPVTLKQ
ncbi:MAG: V-type ATP synthase subunit I [Acutalibacteraceae bacterium]